MASMATDATRTGFSGPDQPPSWQMTRVLGVQVAVTANVFAAALELKQRGGGQDRKSTRLNSSHVSESRMPSSA